ncbi:hypothetical protein TrST_g729 [Triparma strigata]|uniref:RING-type domain-containing protein n=2 Tax=Triparma strigata TaxID=1606541 RepID=A0A9W7BAX1_9STRA|nr:hypothetical protein TrST_g729 [Triparma strigata]
MRSKRTRGVEEKEDGAETGSELMAFLFKTLDQKNVDYVNNVNAFLVGLLHKEDERETKEENGEAAVCAICKESEPNAKILPCGHSASCSMCTQTVINCGNRSGKCPFCRGEFERFEVGKWSNTTRPQDAQYDRKSIRRSISSEESTVLVSGLG